MNRKPLFITLAALLLVVIAFIFFILFNPSIGFTYYEPSYLPEGISIKAKRISIHEHGPTQVEQNFRTEDWVYTISEYKALEDIGSAVQNYDETSIKPTCSIEKSPGKTEYRLCHWIDYGKIDVHEIKFVKGGTFIRVMMPSGINEKISVDEISKFVDSFNERSTLGFPVLRSSGA